MCRRFDSVPRHSLNMRVSFSGKTSAFQADVASSILVTRFILWAYSSVGLERTPDKREVDGSSPFRPIMEKYSSG